MRRHRLSYVATHRSAACRVLSHRRATGCPRSIRVASHSCSHVARYSGLPSSLLTHPICDPLPRAPSSNNQSVVASTLSCLHRSSLTPSNPNTKKRASIRSLSCVAWSIFLSFLVWVWVRLRCEPPQRLGYNPRPWMLWKRLPRLPCCRPSSLQSNWPDNRHVAPPALLQWWRIKRR